MRRHWRPRVATLALAGTLVLSGGACSSDGDDPGSGDAPATPRGSPGNTAGDLDRNQAGQQSGRDQRPRTQQPPASTGDGR